MGVPGAPCGRAGRYASGSAIASAASLVRSPGSLTQSSGRFAPCTSLTQDS